MTSRPSLWSLLLIALVAGCSPPALGEAPSPSPPAPATAAGAPSTASAPAPSAAPRPQASSTTPSPAPRPVACRAPSLTIRSAADVRDAAGLADCRFARTGQDAIGDACGTAPFDQAVSLDRLDEAAPPLDAATRDRVRSIAARGRARGRERHAFGLVGDSITASPKFMAPFTDARRTTLSPEVRQRLSVADGTTILDVYRGQDVRAGMDSFVAPRAAKVGAQSRWALEGTPAPLDDLVAGMAPAVAVVLYGSNDAAVRYGALDDLVAQYRQRMETIVERLERAGIVPILSTVPRHTLDPDRAPCDRRPGQVSNWRMAVQTSAVSAAAAELACERALPLVDLRWALDAILNHGIGRDGVHPNAYRQGAGVLDARGLQCGYNVRNYVTLRMLTRLWPLLAEG